MRIMARWGAALSVDRGGSRYFDMNLFFFMRLRAQICRFALSATLVFLGLMGVSSAENNDVQLLQAESRLLMVIQNVEEGRLNHALQDVMALNRDVPDFRSAQLLQAQILEFKAGRINLDQMQALMRLQKESAKVDGLQQEIRQRLQANLQVPQNGAIPQEFISLAPDVKHAIAVDASKSRLYLFSNSASGLNLIADFYISVGRLGVPKRLEGDERTPTGVYFITGMIPGEQLPDLYGVGAFPLNYPNDWDRIAGRTGSGIWLHGTPSDEFSRIPQASDGCVVLSNPDMSLLLLNLERRTPVLLAESIHWSPQKEVRAQGAYSKRNPYFGQEVANWQRIWQQLNNPEQLSAVYDPMLLGNGRFKDRIEKQKEHMQTRGVELQSVSVYAWEDEQGQLRIVNVTTSPSPTYKNGLSVRQYWRRSSDGSHWVIFSEDILAQLP